MSESTFLTMFRREDLLALTVEGVNLRLEGDPAALVRVEPAEPALLVFHFPPQHALEEAFFQDDAGTLPAGPVPVRAWLAGASRLAFRVPDDIVDIPVTVESLLDWRRLEPVLAANALPPDTSSGPAPAQPGSEQTALELPTGLMVSPDLNGVWDHRVAAHERGGRYALWTTRLAATGADGAPATVRAVWGTRPPVPFRHALHPDDSGATSNAISDDIVRLSADFTIPRPPLWARLTPLRFAQWRQRLRALGLPLHYVPQPALARRVQLSALGAWAHLESAWDYPTIIPGSPQADLGYDTLSLEQWAHLVAQGRDQYVRTVQKAFVCDTGHRVSIVTITEREFHPTFIRTDQTPNGPVGIFGSVAYLRQREQILVQQRLQDYDAQADAFRFGRRELPFRRLELTTSVTPFIDRRPPEDRWFWPSVGGQRFRFALVGTHWDGETVALERPLLVIPLRGIRTAADWTTAIAEYNAPAARPMRVVNLAGRSIAFAPSAPAEPARARLETATLTFEAQPVAQQQTVNLPVGAPPFLPALSEAEVSIPALNRVTGRSQLVAIRLDDAYLANGIDGAGNPGEVFAKLVTPPELAVAADRAGGLVRPQGAIEALSRSAGPVDKVASYQAGAIDTAAFDAFRLLGTIKVSDILRPNVAIDRDAVRAVQGDPAAVAARLADPAFFVQAPVLTGWPEADADVTRLVWKPEIDGAEFGPFFAFRLRERGQLILTATLRTPRNGAPPTFAVDGALERFAVDFVGSLSVNLDALRFRSVNGRKPDVSAEGVDLVFQGPLTFVNTLREVLPQDGFSDPPAVTVDGAGILAGYTLGVPSLGVGIFSLQNLALSAQLSVPFVGKPAAVRFAVSERHKPFLVSVTLFGGGGFFVPAMSANGLEQIEAAIEFGGNLSLNLGVASGGVYVMAGIYFSLTGEETKLTGYLRCGGYLSVLGLISITVEFYLGFTFRSKSGGGGEVWGQASVKVAVKVAFFSTSVTLTVERRFAGAAGDPTFAEVVGPSDWDAYCLAFA